ncbi:MAG TPA: diol dehydratase reactivase ATPase-like domain-containing protein [Thermoleophilaceae bacterium]|nr:diol dehydratase reactivase ATPase-like domain-containing protein [Thermoleophilaceae bacterium]
MILACIDIGTNTTRLLVADAHADGLRELESQRAFTRIGRVLRDHGSIPRDTIEETAAVVAAQARLAREIGAEQVLAVATAAIRDARNREELAAAVEDSGGMPLWVLTAEEEARLSFVGATRTLPDEPEGPIAVVDVGGGSSEVAIGDADGTMRWSESFGIGSGVLADRFLTSDPPSEAELEAARRHVHDALAGLRSPPARTGVAVGGTATSMRRLVGGELSPEALEAGIGVLATAPIAEVAARYELDPERVRLLPAGILLLEAFSERLELRLRIARGGLREGAIVELLTARGGE